MADNVKDEKKGAAPNPEGDEMATRPLQAITGQSAAGAAQAVADKAAAARERAGAARPRGPARPAAESTFWRDASIVAGVIVVGIIIVILMIKFL